MSHCVAGQDRQAGLTESGLLLPGCGQGMSHPSWLVVVLGTTCQRREAPGKEQEASVFEAGMRPTT